MRKIPLKIGIRIDPPAVIYIYRESGALRMRSMPLRNLWPNSDVEFVIEDFRNRHGEHIEDVPDFALRKMLNIIKKTKQGKTLQQAITEVTNGSKNGTEKSNNDTILEKLKTNNKTSSNNNSNIPDFSLKSKDTTSKGEHNTLVKKKEFPKKISFGSSLYDELRLAESKMTKVSSFKKENNFESSEKDADKLQPKRPASLDILSTTFNLLTPQDSKPLQKRNSFLLDLEKDLKEIEVNNSKKDKQPEILLERKAAINSSENKERSNMTVNQVQIGHLKEARESKEKKDDDTDVEFDDSDNPLDDPEDDFW